MLEICDLKTALFGPVTLTVAAGECVAVMGPSGAGKSRFLRAIADLDPNEGAVRLDGLDRAALPAPRWRSLVAMVPAESGWWADDVAAHFADAAEAAPLLRAVGLPDALDWEVARLSSGERQRLALVRALAAAPRALLLDEPSAALDETAAAAVEALIRDRMAAGVAVILVTHDRAQAARLAARRFRFASGALTPEAAA